MSVVQKMIGRVLRPVAEWQARGRSGEAFAADLERSGRDVTTRFRGANDTPGNRELGRADPGLSRRVRHNDLGDLSVGGWLAYLEAHARRESLRVRG